MNINWKNIYLTILRDGGHPVLKTVQYSYNIGPTSVRRLQFTNEEIKFLASFDGRVEEVIIKEHQIIGLDDIGGDNIQPFTGT